MQSELRARLAALAARVAAEKDPIRFHALVLELNQLLERNDEPTRIKGTSESPTRDGK
ncbi:MAG TPA: hypothetical protein VH350_03330 [Candidatus Sulfotelmatobacter sp.]|nr:hypothetical protein [Candidatus Sulfotelmatobacter sp.]